MSLSIVGRRLHLHTTGVLSGLLLIAVGLLLATGQLTWLTRRMASSEAAQFYLSVEAWLDAMFRAGR